MCVLCVSLCEAWLKAQECWGGLCHRDLVSASARRIDFKAAKQKKKKEHRSHPGFWFCRALVDISMENITTFRHFLNKTINHFIEKRTGASICNENNHLLQPWCSQLVSQKISAWELWEIALSYGRCIWNPWGFGKNNQRPNSAVLWPMKIITIIMQRVFAPQHTWYKWSALHQPNIGCVRTGNHLKHANLHTWK